MTIEDVIAAVEEHTGQKVSAHTELKDLGLDSLDFMDLILQVSKECGEIPDSAVPSLETVNDLFMAADGLLI